ncbi:MAG: N-acetylmuramoyl-L-alanine amidase [Patescibacteria group bacterium]|nr:N-acetylmuramoyl-L-alanine amidase [Patescibacteria group bacterium]
MLIKDINHLITILTLLITLNNNHLINDAQLLDFLSEIYYQPYPEFSKEALYFRYPNFDNFQKPTTTKIAIQIGHLIEGDIPFELRKLARGGGAIVNGIKEVEINKAIAFKIKEILEKENYYVEILPAIIPKDYYADIFISLHANSADEYTSGFMISTPFIDYSGKANKLKKIMIREYSKETKLRFINKVTSNMTHYYAFNWSKFKRAIHPKTPAIIIEMGNMRNKNDLNFLLNNQEKIAKGIIKGIKLFLEKN